MLDLAIEQGLDPIVAILMVTLNPAQYFGLKDLGAIAPGYRADILILSSLRPVKVETVIKRGKKIFERGEFTYTFPERTAKDQIRPMCIKPYDPDAFVIARRGSHLRE